MICLVVIMDMLNTISRAAIGISSNDDIETKPKAALGIIGSLWGIMLIIIIMYSLKIFNCLCHCSWEMVIVIFQSATVCLFFLGDNLYYVMNRYGGCLPDCDSDCVKRSSFCGTACSAGAAICYVIAKFIQEHTGLDNEDNFLDFKSMIAVIAQMDLLYTIATSEITGISEVAVNSTILIVVIIIGSSFIMSKAIKQWKQHGNLRVIVIMTIFICISLVFHTLGDNPQPLDSIPGIMCITDNFNSTENCLDEEPCRNNSITRLVLAIISFVLTAIPTAYSFTCQAM